MSSMIRVWRLQSQIRLDLQTSAQNVDTLQRRTFQPTAENTDLCQRRAEGASGGASPFMGDRRVDPKPISGTNQSSVSEFLLLGLSRQPQQQHLLFVLFLTMYLATVLGNLLIILAVSTDSRLHTPMYFFLSNLSFVDICFSSTTIPKMLANHILGTQTISFCGCLTQMYFVFMFVDMDNFLLAVMAYDRFVAVCHPLHYTAKMTHQLCALLVAGSWVVANLNVLLHTLLMARLSFCADNAIPHFFCDVTPLLKLSCSDTHLNEVIILSEGALVMITPFLCILASYMHITCTVLRVPSTKGRWKAFSTCGSHLAVVLLFYGTIIAVYFNPVSSHSAEKDTTATVLYTVVTPMLNPFIYSLRNRYLKGALRKVVGRVVFSV
ncbi:olfactory receptor 1F1 isoform X1 [Nomascus leucogenys]|uniref:olfactory receptor 1F1 isoform X1 n=1 Tax=Nomascus leucogenys TaxID=61853 RepID=UPI00122D9E8A|nr:olfactory receptor 1F1 isoform X1 [Nomascus leucogenys]